MMPLPALQSANPYTVLGRKFSGHGAAQQATDYALERAAATGKPVNVHEQDYGMLHVALPSGEVGPAHILSKRPERLPNPEPGEPSESKLLAKASKPGNTISQMARIQQQAHDWGLYSVTAAVSEWMRAVGATQSEMERHWRKRPGGNVGVTRYRNPRERYQISKPRGYVLDSTGTQWYRVYPDYESASNALVRIRAKGYHANTNSIGGMWRVVVSTDDPYATNPRRRANAKTRKTWYASYGESDAYHVAKMHADATGQPLSASDVLNAIQDHEKSLTSGDSNYRSPIYKFPGLGAGNEHALPRIRKDFLRHLKAYANKMKRGEMPPFIGGRARNPRRRTVERKTGKALKRWVRSGANPRGKRISKKQWVSLGGLSNPLLFRIQKGGKWLYYSTSSRGNPRHTTKRYRIRIPATADVGGYELTIKAKTKVAARKEAKHYCAKQFSKATGKPQSKYRLPANTKVTEIT